ncbi:hypothetical protein SGPA1_20065 [Streptomyces misionensis JCM 4497]
MAPWLRLTGPRPHAGPLLPLEGTRSEDQAHHSPRRHGETDPAGRRGRGLPGRGGVRRPHCERERGPPVQRRAAHPGERLGDEGGRPRHRLGRRPRDQPCRRHRRQHGLPGRDRQDQEAGRHRRGRARHQAHARYVQAADQRRRRHLRRPVPLFARLQRAQRQHVLLPDRRALRPGGLHLVQQLRAHHHAGHQRGLQLPGQRLRPGQVHQLLDRAPERGRQPDHLQRGHPECGPDRLPARLHHRYAQRQGHRAQRHRQLR